MVSDRLQRADLVDSKVNVRIALALLWVSHFILWIFGDMFALLQDIGEPVTDSLILFVAPTTAIVLTLMVAFTLFGPPAYVRLANLVVAPIYLLFNIGFIADAATGWEYYLGIFYVAFSALIAWTAVKWPQTEAGHNAPRSREVSAV